MVSIRIALGILMLAKKSKETREKIGNKGKDFQVA